jgi:hypothetical protein
MALAAWPSQVPARPVLSGAQVGASYGEPIRSETAGGPPLVRPRPGPRVTEIPFVSTMWTRAEWAAFEQFARDTLFRGTQPFRMPVFRPDGGMVMRICQISDGKWSTDMSAVSRYRVSFTLIVFNW